ncbi:sulfite exporter TauE/SafE family protein [Streptococcus sp. X16XC17]|uniref:sulfite exporter TauE/SafE family protein n=1 Tax=unclassified Streptococcus TaxID=2608887 RepID=UPI00066FB76A|nr:MULTISPECIES: sulfite exporter TauE/SafE family protein [unclassified Streptococcus]TCD46344.1 sulfite exporter TauE/SafE family protein [Streptococcus sp. X16XC17]
MLIYLFIVLLATTVGAVTGLGGGVIIKPLFDMIGQDTPSAIGFYSSVVVFTMCLVAIYKQYKKGFSFDLKMLLSVSIGSVIGGLLGGEIFSLATRSFSVSQVKVIQASLLLLTLVTIVLYTINKEKIATLHTKNLFVIFALGLFLGTISVFLGIGGGPLNVALLMYLFSFSIRDAAVYSIATIFFSQFSNLSSAILTKESLAYNLGMLPYLMVVAIIGGYLGTLLNQRLSEKNIERFYMTLMVLLMIVSIYNIASNL